MKNKKWYYKLYNDNNEEEVCYCAVNMPINSEMIAEILGIEKFNYTVTEISEEEYLENTENEE